MSWRTRKQKSLPLGAKILRDALYADPEKLPTHSEKTSVYQAIRHKYPDAQLYTMKRHLSWCSGKEKARQRKAAERRRRLEALVSVPTPVVTLTHAAPSLVNWELQWAMAHAEPLLRLHGYHPGPTIHTIRQWAGEAVVSVGAMAEAIHRLELDLTNFPQ